MKTTLKKIVPCFLFAALFAAGNPEPGDVVVNMGTGAFLQQALREPADVVRVHASLQSVEQSYHRFVVLLTNDIQFQEVVVGSRDFYS